MYIIGDIAGQFSTLLRLVERIPKNEEIVLLGDLVDRGPDSKDVVQWAMDNAQRVKVIKGNHEDMMIDWYEKSKRYEHGVWVMNGGDATLRSYERIISQDHIDFLKSLPIHLDYPGLYLSHAPSCASSDEFDMIWNRSVPIEMSDVFQIFGHNSYWGLKVTDKWACIDTSSSRVLTAMHWPSKQIIQQEYI